MHSTLHRDKNILSSCVFPNPSQRVPQNTVFQSDCICNSNTCTITRSHLRVFKLKKRRFLSLDMNISLKQHKDTYGFHKGDLVEQTRSTQISEHNIAYNFHLVSPQLSLKHSEETINSLKAIHFTNTQVYEYFPDWFRSGSLNSPITQVSIKLDRFIPFKVLQLVRIQKLILMHTFAWLKQQYHGINNTHQLPLF